MKLRKPNPPAAETSHLFDEELCIDSLCCMLSNTKSISLLIILVKMYVDLTFSFALCMNILELWQAKVVFHNTLESVQSMEFYRQSM